MTRRVRAFRAQLNGIKYTFKANVPPAHVGFFYFFTLLTETFPFVGESTANTWASDNAEIRSR